MLARKKFKMEVLIIPEIFKKKNRLSIKRLYFEIDELESKIDL